MVSEYIGFYPLETGNIFSLKLAFRLNYEYNYEPW